MRLPGFTAASAVYGTQRPYRSHAVSGTQSVGVTPQWSDRICTDQECLRYCEERTPWDAGHCSDECQSSCSPYEPPEMLPP